jgi:hypothetical protein
MAWRRLSPALPARPQAEPLRPGRGLNRRVELQPQRAGTVVQRTYRGLVQVQAVQRHLGRYVVHVVLGQ